MEKINLLDSQNLFFMENNLGGKGKSWTWFNYAFHDDALFYLPQKMMLCFLFQKKRRPVMELGIHAGKVKYGIA